MTTRSRIRRTLDFGRLRDALSGPGADPRTWVTLARVDEADDAVRWVEGVGWVADVTIASGELAQDGPVPVRLPSSLGASGSLAAHPVAQGSLLLVSFVDGDPNTTAVALGYLFAPEDVRCAETVNGQNIDKTLASSTSILVSDKNLEVELGSTARVSAADTWKLLAQNVLLADDNAAQSYVRGDDQKDALDDFLNALDTWAGLVATGIAAGGGSLDNTAFLLATQLLRAQLVAALSSRIKGE